VISPQSRGGRFRTTRWSLIRAATDPESPGAAAALSELCTGYWYPVYGFIRRSGHSAEDSEDLTQAFFARVLEKGSLGRAQQERGRFRSFLLASVKHFLANDHDWRTALKRGGGTVHLPLEFEVGEQRYLFEPTDHLTPERLFERRWAVDVLDRAMRRVATRYALGGKSLLFAGLQPLVAGEGPASYASVAAQLGMTEGAARVAAHRLRRQFAAVLRDVVAETVNAESDIEEELRYLLTVAGG
jgi:RNA polymerase sigma-70 factor (ECF subfamily)